MFKLRPGINPISGEFVGGTFAVEDGDLTFGIVHAWWEKNDYEVYPNGDTSVVVTLQESEVVAWYRNNQDVKCPFDLD